MSMLTDSITNLFTSIGGKIQGLGTAGTPAGGVVTAQGWATVGGVGGTLPTYNAVASAPYDLYTSFTQPGNFPGSVVGFAYDGVTFKMLRTPVIFKPLSAVVITAETTIWTPVAGKKFRIMGYVITQGVVTGAITLKDNTAGATILIIPPNTIGVHQVSPAMGNGILSAAANNVLTATGVSTETITGFVFGTEE